MKAQHFSQFRNDGLFLLAADGGREQSGMKLAGAGDHRFGGTELGNGVLWRQAGVGSENGIGKSLRVVNGEGVHLVAGPHKTDEFTDVILAVVLSEMRLQAAFG